MISLYLLIASGLTATTYGWGEYMCGDIGEPRQCIKGEITASGAMFNPEIPQVAVASPTNMRLREKIIYLRYGEGLCYPVLLVDKMAPKWIGIRGFDLTPAAVRKLTGKEPHRGWSGLVHVCPTVSEVHGVRT